MSAALALVTTASFTSNHRNRTRRKVTTTPRRSLPWSELHGHFMSEPAFGSRVREICTFDWAKLPVTDLGSRLSGAKLTSAVMSQFPSAIELASSRRVYWEQLCQRDLNAHRLTGGIDHPFERIKRTYEKMRIDWPWCRDHQVLLPPLQMYSGRLEMIFNDEPVDAEVIALPPIECIGVLRSTSLGRDDDASTLALLWYQSDFGLDPRVLALIQHLDWDRQAAPLHY